MVKNGIKNKRLYFIIIWLAIFVGVSVLVFTNTKTPLKAETNFYASLDTYIENYCIDYTTPANYSGNGITITNNQDGTFSLNGTTTAVVEYTIPVNIPYGTSYCSKYYDYTASDNYSGETGQYTESCGIMVGLFAFNTQTLHLYGGSNDYPPAMTIRFQNGSSYNNMSNAGRWGSNFSTLWNYRQTYNGAGNIAPTINYNKYFKLVLSSATNYDNLTILPFFIDNIKYASSTQISANAMFEYFNLAIGPAPNKDVYFTNSAPNGGYTINQKINSQFGVNLLPALRYNLVYNTTELTIPASALQQYPSANIDIIKLTAPNGNIYSIYYDNIENSNTRGSWYINDNGTINILQSDAAGFLTSVGLDNLISMFQHAITYNSVITSVEIANNLYDKLYVFDTDFGYAKGVADGSANYQPGQSGYNTIYNAGYQTGTQTTTNYYNSYYGGSDGVGGAGYTSIYNAGVEAGADISVNWVFKCMSAVGSFLSIEILPNITFGALIGIPFIITLAWFIIRQLRGGGGS